MVEQRGWMVEQRGDGSPVPAPPPNPVSSSCPCHQYLCTHRTHMYTQAIPVATCTDWHAGTYRHAHMHTLTRALECATVSACPHASACAHVRMHCTYTQTHINTHTLSHTHTHTHTNT
jgi:hypothetical protein